MASITFQTTSDSSVTVEEAALQALSGQLRGDLILASDDRYDDARAVWNGMIDKKPAAIAACAGTTDVIHTVKFAREHGLLVSVRGGGHNVSGNAICDGGLVIDLSPMRGVHVDAKNQMVRAAGGVTIGDLDQETQAFGLAVPMGVVTETGIAGLTLGGGLGWMRRKYGLSCDNLIGAEVVTANGEVVTASESENANLLWGLRGGGGNFGIVTSFEFRAYPLGPEVYFAFVIHPWDNAKAALQFYRDWALAAPDEISSFGIVGFVPGVDDIPAEHHHKPMVAYLAMYSGAASDGEKALQPLRDFGQPIVDFSDITPYLEVQQFFDEDYPAGEMHYYWKSSYINGLGDDVIDRLMELNVAAPSHHSTLDLWQMGGAVSRIAADETAFGDRSAPFLLGIEANWEDPAEDVANIQWARDVFNGMKPYATGGEYLNFPGFYEEGDKQVEVSFGDNHARLVELKKKYDPENFFRMNQNIKPDGA